MVGKVLRNMSTEESGKFRLTKIEAYGTRIIVMEFDIGIVRDLGKKKHLISRDYSYVHLLKLCSQTFVFKTKLLITCD